VHVSQATHAALLAEKAKSDRSLEKLVRRILEKHTGTNE
jgi:hypothetical protein